QRSRGVGAHELALHPRADRGGMPVAAPLRHDRTHDLVEPLVGGPDVDESGTGDLDALDERRRRQGVDEHLCDLPRRPIGSLRQPERDVRREVAVLLLPGLLQGRHREVAVETEGRCRRPQAVAQPVLELPFDHGAAPSTSAFAVSTSPTVSNGFWTYIASTPASASSRPRADRKITGTSAVSRAARSPSWISRPSMPGIIGSRMTTS